MVIALRARPGVLLLFLRLVLVGVEDPLFQTAHMERLVTLLTAPDWRLFEDEIEADHAFQIGRLQFLN